MGKFEIKRSKDKQYYFVLKARNGKVIATSKMYKRKASCEKGIDSVIKTIKNTKLFII